MHEHLGSFIQNPSQKFHKNFINFEKPQKIFKNPKHRSKRMKCMIQERNKIILDEENLIWAKDQVRNVKRLSLRSLGERSENLLREIGENER